MKKRTIKQYASALYEITKEKSGKSLDEILDAFIELLVKDRKLKKVDRIIIEFERIVKKEKGIVEIEVISARKLGQDLKKKINKVFDGKAEMKESLDKKLIGGVVVKTEDAILDGSLRTQLRLLERQLV